MKQLFSFLVIFTVMCGIYHSCTKKPEAGFLGNNFLYLSNPFPGIKGRTTTSAAIQADGSTQPVTVKLLGVKNGAGQVTEVLSKEYEIPIYKGEITFADSSLDLIGKKLGTGMYKAFNINETGGRMELSPATAFVETGTYSFDVEVSNVKGSKIINNIAKVVINPSVSSQLIRQFANSSAPGQEVTFTTQTNFSVTLVRRDGPNKIILKFVDKNDVPFNPKTGQVLPRVSVPPTNLRYDFRQFAPFYAEEKTDTALVYSYPEKTPTFPLYTINAAYLSSYRIPAEFNDLNQNLNPELAFRLFPTDGIPYVSGTWVVTNKLNFAAKK